MEIFNSTFSTLRFFKIFCLVIYFWQFTFFVSSSLKKEIITCQSTILLFTSTSVSIPFEPLFRSNFSNFRTFWRSDNRHIEGRLPIVATGLSTTRKQGVPLKSVWQLNAPELLGVCIGSGFAGYHLGMSMMRIIAKEVPGKNIGLLLVFSMLVLIIVMRNRRDKAANVPGHGSEDNDV